MAKDVKELPKDLHQILKDIVFDTQREIIQNTPVNTGRLRQSIIVEEVEDGWIIGTNMEYGLYQELGTGIYGPLKKPIKPTTKQALAWGRTLGVTKDGKPIKEFVAKEVKGVHPAFMFLKGENYADKRLRELFKK